MATGGVLSALAQILDMRTGAPEILGPSTALETRVSSSGNNNVGAFNGNLNGGTNNGNGNVGSFNGNLNGLATSEQPTAAATATATSARYNGKP